MTDENDFKCVICLEEWCYPCTLACGHNFCEGCTHKLQQKHCPLCRTTFYGEIPKVNLGLHECMKKLSPTYESKTQKYLEEKKRQDLLTKYYVSPRHNSLLSSIKEKVETEKWILWTDLRNHFLEFGYLTHEVLITLYALWDKNNMVIIGKTVIHKNFFKPFILEQEFTNDDFLLAITKFSLAPGIEFAFLTALKKCKLNLIHFLKDTHKISEKTFIENEYPLIDSKEMEYATITVGTYSGYSTLATGYDTLATGYYSTITTGNNGTIIGHNAGPTLTTGDDNIVIGQETGFEVRDSTFTTGDDNIVIGQETGYSSVAIGRYTYT